MSRKRGPDPIQHKPMTLEDAMEKPWFDKLRFFLFQETDGVVYGYRHSEY